VTAPTTKLGRAGTLTVVGLGPAGPELLTGQAQAALAGASRIYLRTARHPAAEAALALGAIALDDHYESAADFPSAYAAIVDEVTGAALADGGVVYAVPGSPSVLETTVETLVAQRRVEVLIVEGLSFLDLVWSRLGIDPFAGAVRLVDGERFRVDAAADSGPLLLAHLWNAGALSEIKLAIDDDAAGAVVLSHLGLDDERLEHVRVGELDRVVPDHLTCVYLPRLAAPTGRELAALESVVAELRERCPWDQKQTHRSLTRHLIEECYETIEAIDRLGDPPDPAASAALEEELGDVLCQVMFHAQLAKEEGLFALADVARTVREKLVYRHPHVFGGREGVTTVDAVLSQWEELKRQEKGRQSLMDGIPAALPALLLAMKLERKASGVGLGTAVTGGVTGLPNTMADALVADADALGEALCSLARSAADAGVDAEEACRRAAERFRDRFRRAERRATDDGTTLAAAAETDRRRYFAAEESREQPGQGEASLV
jgi:tetrapyrrole methylase family protein / MazG family protein